MPDQAVHIDPLIPPLVGVIAVVLLLGLLLRAFRQPQLVGYIVAGVVIGPAGLALVTDQGVIEHLGSIGVTLLMFFIGMEVSPRHLLSGWRIAVFGTLFQVIVSVGCIWGIGTWLGWSIPRIVLLGFVISLSSTAVVLKLLQDRNEMESQAGRNVVLILLSQDLIVVPMLMIISLLSGERLVGGQLIRQTIGGAIIIGLAALVVTRPHIRLPFATYIRSDREIQIFAGLLICFGLSYLTGMLGLSAALGAFVGGLVVASAQETDWIRNSLEPFRIMFVGIMFVAIGMLIDPSFFMQYWWQILTLVMGVLVTNTFINAIILRALGSSWHDSLYSGALLAQIGEFSFILASMGFQAGIIEGFSYQMTIAVTSVSLLVSALWIAGAKSLLKSRVGTEKTL